jgi:hypothetical protein
MNCDKCRSIGAMWAIGQGLASALVPQLSVVFVRKMIGKNFENAGELEAKPEYVRQIRALGVGLAAAGVATLAMERAVDGRGDDAEDETGQD